MKDTRELLAMVTPHGIEIGKPFGGIPALTGLDVAGAIGMGVEPMGARLLMVKYAAHDDMLLDLRISWFMTVMEHKREQGWQSQEPGRFKGMADTTLAEHLSCNLCSRCHGRGDVPRNRLRQTCPVCDGSGTRYPSERQMARGVGVSVQSYRETWLPRVQWCRDELDRIERVSVAKLHAHLRP